jgi:hypothetical protein
MGRVARIPLAAIGLLTPAPRSAATTAHRHVREWGGRTRHHVLRRALIAAIADVGRGLAKRLIHHRGAIEGRPRPSICKAPGLPQRCPDTDDQRDPVTPVPVPDGTRHRGESERRRKYRRHSDGDRKPRHVFRSVAVREEHRDQQRGRKPARRRKEADHPEDEFGIGVLAQPEPTPQPDRSTSHHRLHGFWPGDGRPIVVCARAQLWAFPASVGHANMFAPADGTLSIGVGRLALPTGLPERTQSGKVGGSSGVDVAHGAEPSRSTPHAPTRGRRRVPSVCLRTSMPRSIIWPIGVAASCGSTSVIQTKRVPPPGSSKTCADAL